MKAKDLKEYLAQVDDETEVVILDKQKNGYFEDQDGIAKGMYPFTLIQDNITWTDQDGKPLTLLLLSFQSDDFTEDGTIEWGSDLVDLIRKEVEC